MSAPYEKLDDIKYFIWCYIPQRFSGSIIQSIYDDIKIIFCNIIEGNSFFKYCRINPFHLDHVPKTNMDVQNKNLHLTFY